MSWFLSLAKDIDDMHDDGKMAVGGKSFIAHLFSMYWGCRGIPESICDLAYPVLFIFLNVDSVRGTQLQAMIFTPWAMKPLFAVVSDMFPVMGYKKRWYFVMMFSLATLSSFMLYISSPTALGGELATVAFFYLFIVNSAVASCDSMSQGRYTEVCKAKGASVVVLVSSLKITGGFIAAVVGPTLSDLHAQLSFIVAPPLFFQGIFVQGANFMGDKTVEPPCAPDWSIYNKDKKIIITGVTLGTLALSNAALTLALSAWQQAEEDAADRNETLFMTRPDFVIDHPIQLYYALSIMLLIMGMTFWSLPYRVAKINIYIIFCRVATLNFGYVLQQWYTAPVIWCQGTPNFSNRVYQTMGLVTGNLATLAGVALFEKYVSHWPARAAFWVTTLFTCVAALFDLSMITGFNRSVLSWTPVSGMTTTFLSETEYRLDDLMGFLIGTQALKPIVDTLDSMPSTVLLSKLCPAGVETTVFAMLAALQNLGLQISSLLGAQAISWTEVNIRNLTNETHPDERVYYCDTGRDPFGLGMSGLSFCLVVGGILMPLITIPATWLLIPPQRLDEPFVDQDDQEMAKQEVEGAARSLSVEAGQGVAAFPSFQGAMGGDDMAPLDQREHSSKFMFRKGLGGSKYL
jgi:hypothetical protein